MVTLYDRLRGLLCPYDDGRLADDQTASFPPWWVMRPSRRRHGGWSFALVTYDPLLMGGPFVLRVDASEWEFSFAPDGAIDRARDYGAWLLETNDRERAFAAFIHGLQETDQPDR